MYRLLALLFLVSLTFVQCNTKSTDKIETSTPQDTFEWDNANLYFLLTDRFYNGDKTNDVNYGRTEESAVLRGFEGGDFNGITKKINDNYFSDLGIDALWFSPVFEQIEGGVDEGTGYTYPFHGYWIKDWTAIEPNFGTKKELQDLVDAAHKKGIRVVLDVVLNHTGPVTDKDPLWEGWARTGPVCSYQDFKTATACTLVENLPDIYTESEEVVELPPHLLAKWEAEGRKDQEVAELNAFFEKTGLPRTAENYIIKWLLDLIDDYGIDGFRVDTVKHTEEDVWKKLDEMAKEKFAQWKKDNPEKVIDDKPFYSVGELYGYYIGNGREYDFGDRSVDYFDNGFDQLINFQFKDDAKKGYEEIFSYYREQLDGPLKGKGVLNYLSSHDDGSPFDAKREKSFEAATKLLLTPGAAQTYYGDETGRLLVVDGASGDANLRSNMNWNSIDKKLLAHYQKLGKFRHNHPAIGMGAHNKLDDAPYTFSRIWKNDKVVIALDIPEGSKQIKVGDVFPNGTILHDAYNGGEHIVKDGAVILKEPHKYVLLEE